MVYDIAIGSRFCPGGRMQGTVIRTQIHDNLGGYFTVKADNLKRLPFDLIFFGYGDYFFRLLHYAQREHMTIVEIPAQYMGRCSR